MSPITIQRNARILSVSAFMMAFALMTLTATADAQTYGAASRVTTTTKTTYYAPAYSSGTMTNGEVPNFLDFSNMTTGSRSPQVYDLQSFLGEVGYYTFGLPTGYFGPITKKALIAFQGSVDVPATGYFGPLTRMAIASWLSTTAARISLSHPQSTGTTAASTVAVSNSPTLIPLGQTGYWYNGNWYSSIPASSTPNVNGYWVGGTWIPMPGVSMSLASNSTTTVTGSSYTQTYGVSGSAVSN